MRIIRWVMPSIGDVLFLSFLFSILIQGNRLLGDPDTGMHIRAGDYILQTYSIPLKDIFSHTMLGQPWVAHEWLSEVVFSFIHRVAGLNGLVVLTALLISGTFLLLFHILLKQRVNFLLAVFLTILATSTASIHWLVRPHIFSMTLTLIWFYLLDSYQRTMKQSYLYPLPFLMMLWVNLHGGYFTGFILLTIYLLGNLCDVLFYPQSFDQKQHQQRIISLGLVIMICLVIALANPSGYRILLLPFQFMHSQYILDRNVEWLSPSFHGFSIFEFYLLLIIVVIGLSLKMLSFIEIGLLIFSFHIALFAVRFIPLFAVIVTPIIGKQIQALITDGFDQRGFSDSLQRILNKFLALSGRIQSKSAIFQKHLIVMVVVGIILILVFCEGYLRGRIFLNYQYDKDFFPVQAVEFIEANRLTGKMYNSYWFGSYLIYQLYPDPNYRVFQDGRAMDLYGEEFFKNTFKIVDDVQPGWKEILDRYQVGWIIEHANSPLSAVLFESPNWILVYADKVAHIFVRNTPEYHEIIRKYPGVHPDAFQR